MGFKENYFAFSFDAFGPHSANEQTYQHLLLDKDVRWRVVEFCHLTASEILMCFGPTLPWTDVEPVP